MAEAPNFLKYNIRSKGGVIVHVKKKEIKEKKSCVG
jgi:hypothetical protein